MKNRVLALIVSALMLLSMLLLAGCDDVLKQLVEIQNQLNDIDNDITIDDGTQDLADGDLPDLPAGIIPLEVIMGAPEYMDLQISGDGEKILYRHMTEYSDYFVVEEWETGKQTIIAWPYEADGIPSYLLAPDSDTVLFFVDDSADENYGIYTSNISTGETKTILPAGDNDCRYVADNPANENEIYIIKFDFTKNLFDLYLLNYITGKHSLVLKNPAGTDIIDYVFDNEGSLRGVGTIDADAGIHYYIKKDAAKQNTKFVQSEWKEILYWSYEDTNTSGVFGFMQDNERLLLVDTANSNTSTLCTYDINTGQKQDIYNNPDYDINGSWTDLELDEVVAVSVYSQKIEWVILDESFQDDYDILAGLEDGVFNIIDSSSDDEYWIVEYVSDVHDSDYYIYDMSTQEATYLFNGRQELLDYDFAPKELIEFTASDGLVIEGYATFPVGTEHKDLPTVLLVHGGPNSRDTWEYDPEAQFLANRGYLVLQVNFRGSTGYGRDFTLAGDKEWGGKMHQDILDAVGYAVVQGWTDPQRVGVYGGSYGGYEALICAAFSSDVFKCAVDAFGPSSLLTLVESIRPQWKVSYEDFIRMVGDPKTEAEFMRERSPLYYADQMEIPLLIIQGENDTRVVQSESDQMVEALQDAGVPVEYILLEGAGHGWGSTENSIKVYTAMEEFFAEYLGGFTE